MPRQVLLESIESGELTKFLDRGGRVVYLRRVSEAAWDAVLETIIVDEPTPVSIILDFLYSINPRALEEKMLEGGMDEGPGTAALKALTDLVTGAKSAT